MNKLFLLLGILAVSISAGCSSDIVCTEQLKMLEYKCVYIEPLQSEDPHVGQVLRDAFEKEFMRKGVSLCDTSAATVFLSGSTFMTVRGTASRSGQYIESITVVGKNSNGEVLLSASYDNKERYSASRLAKEFGSALAGKLR
jgi:hypothetical protein